MKKLLFLLLVMALGAGMVFAMTPDDPPGVFNPETIMAENSVQQGVVIQPAVLVLVTPITVDPSSFHSVVVQYDIAIRSHKGMINLAQETRKKADRAFSAVCADYYLRC
jgi:hypothetical protein